MCVALRLISVFAIVCASSVVALDTTNLTRKYEYLFSFKPPMLAQANGEIPFFEHGGQAIASTESIRLTPSMVNKKGWVWSKRRANFSAFEAEFSFRVTGRGRIGADGLAFWFVADKSQGGPVYGAADKWNGLGLFFDTYDNDGSRNNPIVMAVINNGSKEYLHDLDGEGQQAGHCIRDFRNRAVPIRAKVHYYMNTLEVYVGHGMVEKDQDVDLCFVANNVDLPQGGYFGFSGATGELADDHDVYRLEVHSLRLPGQPNGTSEAGPSEAERAALDKEFSEYTDKLQKAEEEFQKQQESKPVKERKGKKLRKSEDAYREDESESSRNLRQIWEAQSFLLQLTRETSKKLDTFSKDFSKLSLSGGSSADVKLPDDLVKRNDISIQTETLQALFHKLKGEMDEMKSVVMKLGDHPSGDTQYDQVKYHNELRDMINDIGDRTTKRDKQMEERLRDMVRLELTRLSNSVNRDCGSCLSTSLFILLLVSQTVLIILFLLYQHHQANSVKKFY